MRLIFTFLILTIVSKSNAQYVFTGNGNWTDLANWQGGIKPPLSLPGGATISIQGTAVTSQVTNDIQGSYGDITIEVGGSLNIRTNTQFQNQGGFIVKGTYINNTVWENYPGANVIVEGTLINRRGIYASGFTNKGTVTIKNGGVFRNEQGLYSNNALWLNYPAGYLVINTGGSFLNFATATLFGNVTNNGSFTNSSVISGQPAFSGSLNNEATIAPGASPGVYAIDGNYIATSSAIHSFEVAGTATENYDRINATGTVSLAGTLNVSLTGGFTPSTPHSLPIITGTINGTFATVNLPAGYSLMYNTSNVTLQYGSALPVNFLNLNIKKEASGNRLNWKISEEINVLRYEIERSVDGKEFYAIGSVSATKQSEYFYMDGNPLTRSFYRIKSIDVDGKVKYSSIINFGNGKSNVVLRVFPVPAQNRIVFQHPTAAKENQITIHSIDGKIIQITKAPFGAQQTDLFISSLNKGVYVVSFRNEGEAEEKIRIVKL
jgi:hypothetical protein